MMADLATPYYYFIRYYNPNNSCIHASKTELILTPTYSIFPHCLFFVAPSYKTFKLFSSSLLNGYIMFRPIFILLILQCLLQKVSPLPVTTTSVEPTTTMLGLQNFFVDGIGKRNVKPIETGAPFECQSSPEYCVSNKLMLYYSRPYTQFFEGGDELKCLEHTTCVIDALYEPFLSPAESKNPIQRRILLVSNPSSLYTLSVEGIMFTNGYNAVSGGAIYVLRGIVKILLCSFVNNGSGMKVSFGLSGRSR